MKNCIRTIFVLALLVAALSTASFASSVYFVQGIAGRIRDGTAASPLAAESASRVVPLAQAAWHFAQQAVA